jgi:hypothetical protein
MIAMVLRFANKSPCFRKCYGHAVETGGPGAISAVTRLEEFVWSGHEQEGRCIVLWSQRNVMCENDLLAIESLNFKLQTRPLVREDALHEKGRK